MTAPRRRDSISGRRRWAILQRDGFSCAYCGARPGNDKLHVDHIVPVSRRGSDHENNLVTACAQCNLAKGAQIAVPARMCAEPRNSQGWTTWRAWGGWKLEWHSDAIYLDFRDSYPIDLSRVHEPDWREHVLGKAWPDEVREGFIEGLAFSQTLIRRGGRTA